MPMTVGWADQYNKPCVLVNDEKDVAAVILKCHHAGAVIYSGNEKGALVVTVRPEMGPKLYTEEALKGSIK